jgi:hypothetical protein
MGDKTLIPARVDWIAGGQINDPFIQLKTQQ